MVWANKRKKFNRDWNINDSNIYYNRSFQMNEFELRSAINEIAEMDVSLTKKGGPSRASRLFDKLIFKQKEVLEHFNLPDTPFYQGLLSFEAIPWDNEIDDLVTLLENESANQRHKSKKPPIELLKEARSSNRDPMFVLPELGIQTHVYTLFVYNKILMYNRDEPEKILEELNLVNNDDLLNTLGIMDSSTDWLEDAESSIAALEARGLKYIRRYLTEIINDLKKAGLKINGF